MRPNTPVKVYVAAPWVRKQDAIAAGEQLKQAGFEITSRWFNHPDDAGDPTGIGFDTLSSKSKAQLRFEAISDIEDVQKADVLVVLNLEKSEGKAVETGVALTMAIPVISVGTRSNLFQVLGHEVSTLEEAINEIRTLYPRPALS